MKTGSKIAVSYFGAVILFALVNLFVCVARYHDSLPRMQAFISQLDTVNIRVVQIVDDTKSKSCRIQVYRGNEYPQDNSISNRLEIHGVQMQIKGDTLILPATQDARITSSSVEMIILPDGTVKAPDFTYEINK